MSDITLCLFVQNPLVMIIMLFINFFRFTKMPFMAKKPSCFRRQNPLCIFFFKIIKSSHMLFFAVKTKMKKGIVIASSV